MLIITSDYDSKQNLFFPKFLHNALHEWAKLTNKFASLNLTSANHSSVSILQQTGTLFRFKDCFRKEVQTWRRWRKNKEQLLTEANLAAKEGVKTIILSPVFYSCSNSPISDLTEWFFISASSEHCRAVVDILSFVTIDQKDEETWQRLWERFRDLGVA